MKRTLQKILIVVESIDVDDSSGSKANVALIKNLHNIFPNIKVYHYTRKEIHLEGIPCIAIKENRKSLFFFLSRMERYTRNYLNLKLHIPLENTFGFSFTLFNDRNSIVATLKKMNDFKPDLVLTLSKGGSFRPHHALLKLPKLHDIWMAYMHDPYPMHHYPKPFTWIEPGHRKKEAFIKEISLKARYTAFPSLLLKKWMGGFYPDFNKGIVIPHQVISLDTSREEFPDYFDPQNFNILHAGNLLGARNPKVLLEAFHDFIDKIPEAKGKARLLFLGGNNKRVRAMAKNCSYIHASEAYVSFEKVFKMQQYASANVILEAKAEISPFLPGKFPHCISAEKPIFLLGPKKSEAKRLLGENYEYWSEIDDVESITNHLISLYKVWETNPDLLNQNYSKLKEYLSEPYLENIFKNLED